MSGWEARLPLDRMAATYRADGFGRDDTKLWLQLEWRGLQPLPH